MSQKVRDLAKKIDDILNLDSKLKRDREIPTLTKFYNHLENDGDLVPKGLAELTVGIMKLAKREIEEVDKKWKKTEHDDIPKSASKYKTDPFKTPVFEISTRHLKMCCRQPIDHNTVPWIPYCLSILSYDFILSADGLEGDVSNVLHICAMASRIQWADHSHLQKLWDFIWRRIETADLKEQALRSYCEVAVEMMKNVDYEIYETSSHQLVRRAIRALKMGNHGISQAAWTSTRKYSIVVVVSFIVHKWGLETRDFILREVFELLDPLLSLINIKTNQSESEILTMQLVDDVIKLSMIETIDGHRSMNEKTEENVRKLVKFAIRESLRTMHRGYSMSPNFQISDEICRFLARWFLAERRVDTVEMDLDESSIDLKSDGRKFENHYLSLEGLIHLSFGSKCVNKHAAWNGAMQILNKILKSGRLNSQIVESIVSILWEKRKSYTSEYLRTAFCALLATVIPQDVRFGHLRMPSIDSILKYTLSLMPNVTSLPNAAILTENILKFRSKQVSKETIRLIWDTVSRTSPACFEVLRLLSALVSFTEFEENSRFANDENVGKWSLRKDVIEWLLIDPSAHSHQLIHELCHYHPSFCYETDEPNTDDQLLRNLKTCHLLHFSSSTVPHKATVTQMRPTDAKIDEIVNYVDCKLKSMLSTELTLPVFVLSYEFSLKFPEVSFDFDLIYKRLPHLLQELEPTEFLQSIQNFSEWPEFLEFPPKFVADFDCLMAYFLKNVENQLIDMTKKWETNPGKIVETLADYCRKWPKMRGEMCKSMQFNRFVNNWILETEGDPYEMSNRFEKYSFLLSYRHLLKTRDTILSRANHLLVAQSVTPQDLYIFNKLICSSFLRNLVPPRRVIGPSFDGPTVALYPKNLEFDQRSVKIYLKRLKKSPFLAQNIVRMILENRNDDTWHLHATVLKIVMEDEQLLTVCIATIPNMIRYLKMYQIHFPPKSLSVRFLIIDKSSITSCQKYLRKPKENGHLISPINLITLFGCEKSTWKRMILQFWCQFEREPALVAERFYEFASESVDLGLQTRVVCILRALTSSEYCRNVLQDEQLKMAFDLTYRAIWMVLVKDQCSPEILELCDDSKLRNDLLGYRIPQIPPGHIDDFRLYEMRVAFSVENFLKFGIESGEDTVDFMDFGLAEFYKQLNENLTEEAIRGNEKRNIYIVDILSTVWLRLPWLRPHIQPIIARFKHISPAWKSFPQPPHLPATKHTFKWKSRFHLTLKFMNFWNQKTSWSRGEFATCLMIMLTSHGGRKHLKTNLIEPKQLEKLKNGTRRNVLCVLAKILKKETSKEDDIEEEVIEEAFFEALTRSAAIFPDIATFTIPFLSHLCVDFKQKVDLGMSKLLSSLKGTPKDNQTVVFCLAECVDSVGLDSLARYESVDPEEPLQYATMWFFVMARLFLQHGYLTHAFAVANVLFDRLSSKKRNTMMIERISLEQINKSEEMIELLVDIYVAEDNSTALSTLPPGVQNRPNVRKVMNKKQKEWMKLVSTAELDPREATILQWLCGLPSARSNDIYLDSILRGRFTEYPKILDTPLKFVYFSLFHTALGTKINLDMLQNPPTILETRLMMLANGTANFEPESIEEHVIQAVRDVREAEFWRASSNFEKASELNEKTKRMVRLAELLVENHAYDAATLILKSWEEECLQWRVPSIDIDLIRIAGESVTCQAGDPRTAEINLRQMSPGKMSEAAIAEWCIVLSKITIDYRNDDVEGIRILDRGCRHLEHKTCVESRLKVLLQFHSICMGQLSKLEEYLETRSYRMKKQVIAEYEKQIEKKNSTPRVSRGTSGGDEMKRTERVKKEMRLEKADVEKVEGLVVSAARKAIQSAFQALSCISQLEDDEEAIRTSSLIVFPLIDVIYKYETDPGVVEALKDHSKTALPSKLWLCATSHLASKCFAIEKTPISRYLSQILCHLVYDYPYHVLHTILMYEFDKNGAQVREFLRNIYSVKTKRDVDKLREVVAMMREAHVAYREIAKLQVKENIRIQRVERDGKTMLVWPRDLKIFKCKLDQLPIPTISQKIGAPGDLSTSNLITWRSYKDVFLLADGLSSPIIWEIQGSDGRWYKSVWKKEDVRQDVLVEQMFDVTNNMLEKRTLRTYNVVPLDTECGIIEFCGGSVSLKELLCGTNREGGLHKEMCSHEPSATQASRMMKEVQSDTSEMRRRVFVEVCQQYSPVFRHFFYRQFPTAQIWRQKIDTYRQSLATWSVVCYMVGLGDRHASNILFDQKECTFVHIDLGMILEYSKRSLPVPEQVPFRITRDVLDPLLIEGIENGRLAEDCTKIMEKLKENNKVILGVASAILRETMSNFREAEQSSGRPSYISEMAIGRLRDKLRGTDDGVTAQSSNLQIRRLLRDATSSDNLSRMFFGWMPFL